LIPSANDFGGNEIEARTTDPFDGGRMAKAGHGISHREPAQKTICAELTTGCATLELMCRGSLKPVGMKA